MPIGRPRRHFRTTDSTNDRARELAGAGAPSGTVVTADEQTAGRGRYGRTWEAPAGSALLYSAVLRPPASEHSLLPLLTAVATAEAIESVSPHECGIKWPNDVWIDERKVGGILIESRAAEWAVVGIGVNVSISPDDFPGDLRWPATSVGSGASVERVLRALNDSLTEWLAAETTSLLDAYRPRDALNGRPIQWSRSPGEPPIPGTAAGVDDDGNLLLAAPDELVAVSSGEVQIRD